MQYPLFGVSPKTSLGGSRQKTTPLDIFWPQWLAKMPPSSRQGADGQTQVWCLDPSERQLGASSMLSISDWPSDESASLCSLSEVLETGDVLPRYFLSPKACRGILRRAAKRGKELPIQLHRALAQVAGDLSGPAKPEDKTR